MSVRILTPGHIKIIKKLREEDFVVVGLLTSKALKGYKKEVVPYRDRKYIIEVIAGSIGGVTVVPQDSLDPSKNIKKYRCTALASGDGFEPVEERAVSRYNIGRITVKLPGEKSKKYSSSRILRSEM